MIRFRVHCSAEASALCRVLNLLAQRGLAPETVSVRLVDGRYAATLRVAGLEAQMAEVIAEKMRSAVTVHEVRWNAARG